jgi:hypothetical protein
VFVHHGVKRNGGDYRDFWVPLVDEAGILVIAPEFSKESFPGSRFYNFGNLQNEEGELLPREQWTYGIIDRLFGALRAEGVTHCKGYGMFGHSAGGQFVHRLLTLGYCKRVIAAVTANAGTYTMPELATRFPYGMGGIGLTEEDLRVALGFRLTVMAGTADIRTGRYFPKEPEAMLQGPTRFSRAHRYIDTAREVAARYQYKCAWTIIDVPKVGHDGRRMSAAAAPIISAALYGAARGQTVPA